MKKETKNQYPILDIIKERWSPRAFSPKSVEPEKIQSLMEAARWAPSSFNGQPWRFILGVKGQGDGYDKIQQGLVEFNQIWSQTAPLLIVALGRKNFAHSGEPNTAWQYDTGASVAFLTLQAMSMGLYMHQMGGFSKQKLIELLEIPADYEPLTVLAIGYMGSADVLPPDFQKMEMGERSRMPFNELVFDNKFGQASNIF